MTPVSRFRCSGSVRLWSALLGCAALLLASCAPAGPGSRQASQSSDRPTPPKTLRLGMIAGSEPTDNIPLSSGGTGGGEHPFMLHAGLTIYDAGGNLLPHLAQRVPTVENGDWKVTPDGQMEVTWKLRPDAKWHDGTPLTASDFVFGLQVARDPDMAIRRLRALSFISDASAPDPTTLVVRWKQLYSFANVNGAMDATTPALPRHIIGDLSGQIDRQELSNSPFWTREFVGLGPYRLGDWVQASQMELLAFDQYFLGRPKIDRVIVRYFGDANVVVASMLSGDIDMIPMGAMKAEQLMTVKTAWESSGVGTTYAQVGGARNYRFQYRDPTAPWAQDVRVRQAIIHLLDRQTLADSLLYGITKPADTLAPPEDPVYQALEQKGLARYPYDPNRGQQLLASAGWTRGADGMYRSASGQLFDLEVRTSGKTDNVREGQALAGEWKNAGLNATPFAFADNASNKDELKAIYPGLLGWPLDFNPEAMQDWISTQIPTQANGWRGRNFGAYLNPRFDALYDEQLVSLETTKRTSLFSDLLKIVADDAVSVFLYYDTSTYTVAYRNGIRGVTLVPPLQQINSWNIQTWEMD